MSGFLPGTIYGLGLNQAALPTGGGMLQGQTFIVNDVNNKGFREVMVVQAGAAIAANKAVKFSAPGVVIPTAAAGDIACGVNDLSSGTAGTGAAVANGNFFLITIRGLCNPLLPAAIAANTALTTGATSGTLAAWTDLAATFSQTNLQSLVASGAGGATLCNMT